MSEAPCTLFWPRSGWSPAPRRPIWPVTRARLMRQRELLVPWVCWEMPIPQKIMAASAVA
jgi:hypothetical protein